MGRQRTKRSGEERRREKGEKVGAQITRREEKKVRK